MKLSIVIILQLLLLLSIPSQGYSETTGIETGDIVDLEYEGKLEEDGDVFDAGRISNANITEGQFIVGFYNGVLGMKVGETKVIMIPPEQGYTSDPSHPLYGKTLIFTIHIYDIVFDISPDTENSTSTNHSTESDNIIGNNSTSVGVSTSASLSISFSLVLLNLIVAIPLVNRYRSD